MSIYIARLRIGIIAMALAACTQPQAAAPTTIPAAPTPAPTATTVPTTAPTPAPTPAPDLASPFAGADGAFTLYSTRDGSYTRHNPQRSAQQFLPASTFKILNSLIALETGVITDESTIITWDGTRYHNQDWNQDHTLASAFKNSVVWYYQEVARRIGERRMRQYVEAAGYGNQNIGGKIDRFWLDGDLRISADEQVAFLRRPYDEDLPFSTRSIQIVKSIMRQRQTADYTLSGKTGTAVWGDQRMAWFVGYLETQGGTYIFALNMEDPAAAEPLTSERARSTALALLYRLGLLPSPDPDNS
ncbi:class D beta-lactamase [Chloroflexia bacterium SDU3-3]|nr:class D beta-lactamase [Chloroflexia bacterium SDU3-3]